MSLTTPAPVPASWIADGPLGRGGMATVWLAHRDTSPPLRVALKRAAAGAEAALRREIELLSELRHAGVVRLVEAGDDGAPWAALAYVPGKTLEETLAAGPLPWSVALDLFAQLAEVLAFLHGRGVGHCDVKPANLLVTPDRKLVLVDFGAARQEGRAPAPRLVGSASWAPPEAATGDVDPLRWDVYAAGVVLYEMITGSTAFPSPELGDPVADSVAVLVRKATAGSLDPGVGVSEDVRALIRDATSPDPGRRPESGLALRQRVRDLEVAGWLPIDVEPEGVSATWPGESRPIPPAASTLPLVERDEAPPPSSTTGWAVTAVAMLLLALASGGVVVLVVVGTLVVHALGR